MLKSLLFSHSVASMPQDPFYDDTVLWLRGDSLSNGNFIDSSKYAHAVTSGTGTVPGLNTSSQKSGAGCIDFVDLTRMLHVPHSTVFNLDNIAFTVDFWLRPYQLSSRPAIWNKLKGNAHYAGWFISVENDGSVGFGNGTWSWDGFTTFTHHRVQPNIWTHIAVVKQGSVATCYINGVGASKTFPHINATCNNTRPLEFGAFSTYNQTAHRYSGLLDEFRLTRAVRYSANFDSSLG